MASHSPAETCLYVANIPEHISEEEVKELPTEVIV